LVLLIGLSLSYSSPVLPFQREITALVFVTICTLGAIAGVYPSKILSLFREKNSARRDEAGPGYLGHHPSCGRFETHVIKIRGKVLCAGCTGLTIGAIAAVMMTLYTILLPIQTPALITLVMGVTLVTAGILQHALGRDPRFHLALNVVLVTGVAVARIGANMLNRGIIVDAYSLALSLYLIVARIDLSRDDHEAVCSSCTVPCERSYVAHRNISIIDG
jgi:hypothetical protein